MVNIVGVGENADPGSYYATSHATAIPRNSRALDFEIAVPFSRVRF